MSEGFAGFAELCRRLSATTKKLEKRARMAEYLRDVDIEDSARAAQWLTGEVFGATDPRALNLGGSSLNRVLKEVSGASDAEIGLAYRRHGDLGDAAFDLLQSRQFSAAALTLGEVDTAFNQIAGPSGKPQVIAAKQRLLQDLLSRASALEAKYLVKLVLGDMRIGVKQAQVEEAIGIAFSRDLKQVRHAVMLLGDLRSVVQLAKADTLDHARMRLFHPLGFMLASPVETVDEALERFKQAIDAETDSTERAMPETAAATPAEQADSPAIWARAQLEDKYDGIRAQLHCGDPEQPGKVALFSRSRDDMTASFPEIAEAFAAVDQPTILDGELLAWAPSDGHEPGRALPFSSLQPRIGRKKITEEMREATPVIFMAFDVLYADGRLLLEEPLRLRRAMLAKVVAEFAPQVKAGSNPFASSARQQALLFHNVEDDAADPTAISRLILAPATDLHSAEQLDQAYGEARARGNEGVILKAKDSFYQPGRRGLAWLKLKRELATLDVVVTSAEWGHGRRAQTLSDVTFAVRDGDALKNVGKAYSGLTDAEIATLTTWFLDHTLEDFGSWRAVEPKIVLEVAFNNLMRSNRHASGFAMRFPRILRIRNDKPVEEIDTLARVEEIYNSQPDKPVDAT